MEIYQIVGLYIGAVAKIVWIISMLIAPWFVVGIFSNPASFIAAPFVNILYYSLVLGLNWDFVTPEGFWMFDWSLLIDSIYALYYLFWALWGLSLLVFMAVIPWECDNIGLFCWLSYRHE